MFLDHRRAVLLDHATPQNSKPPRSAGNVARSARALFVAVSALLSALSVGVAQARTWTDIQGNKSSGDFVRIHNGQVVIKRGTQVLRVRPDQFCEDDLEYIRSKASPEQVKQLPSTEPDRDWTDSEGRTLTGRLVDLQDGKLKLKRADNGKYVTVPIEKFSQEDQRYANEQLAQRERVKQARLAAANAVANNQLPGGGPQPPIQPQPFVQPQPIGQPQPGMAPAGNPLAAMQERAAQMRREHDARQEAMRQAQAQQQAEQQRRDSERLAQAERQRVAQEQQRLQQEQQRLAYQQQQQQQRAAQAELERQRQAALAANQQGMPGNPGGSAFREVYACSNCKREVSGNLKAGDSCPHCHIMFDTKTYANGRVETASFWETLTPGRIATYVVILVGSFLGYLVKTSRSS